MELRTFLNDTGEGIVDFEYGSKLPMRVVVDAEGRKSVERISNHSEHSHVRVRGERLYEFGGFSEFRIMFRKLRLAEERLLGADAVELLGTLDAVPPDDVLRKLARPLASGTYRPIVVESRVRAVQPGTLDDVFAGPFGVPPETRYWRSGRSALFHWSDDTEQDGTRRRRKKHRVVVISTWTACWRQLFRRGWGVRLAAAAVMPIHDPARLNRERIDQWKARIAAGWKPTAFAVTVLDHRESHHTWLSPFSGVYLLAHVVLDGHHRLQAAAELGVPVRILCLWRGEPGAFGSDEPVVELLCAPAGA